MTSPLHSLLLAFAVLMADRHANACCGVGYGLGQRLAPMEDAALSSSLGWSGRFASWNREKQVSPMPYGASEQSLRLELSGILRVARRWQFSLSAPVIRNTRSYGTLSSSATRAGDTTAAGRFEVIPVAGAGRPLAFALTMAVVLPTGTPAARSSDPIGADITGLGTWEIRPGMTFESISTGGWYATASLALGLRAPHREQSRDVQLSPRFYGIGVLGRTIGQEGSLSAGLLHEREGSARVDGRRVEGGGRARTAATAMGAAPLADKMWLTGMLLMDIPIAGAGRNEALTRGATLGLRMAFL